MAAPRFQNLFSSRYLVAASLILALFLAACGGGSEEPDSQAASSPTPEGADAAFPVTINHKYGSTEIREAPQRVVSVGYNDHDAILALGVKPIALRDWFGDQPYATWPWAQDELGDAQPVVLSSGELDFEQIAALRPDLIVGTYSGLTEDVYTKLSQIAPTVAQPGEYIDWGIPWQEQTLVIGRALGKEARAKELVAGVEAQFAAARETHPEFTSQSFFDDALSDQVFAENPYANTGWRTVRNEDDFIYRESGSQLTLDVTPMGEGYTAKFDIGLQLA